MWSKFLTWLDSNKDRISSLAALIGVPVALLGLAYTAFQFRASSHALTAQTAYAVQKDARELMHLFQDTKFVAYLKGNDKGLTTEEQNKFSWQIAEVLQFYVAAFIQDENGTVDGRFTQLLTADFCGFVTESRVAARIAAMSADSLIRLKANACPKAPPKP